MCSNVVRIETSRSVWRSVLREKDNNRSQWKNRSSLPENALFCRNTPFAIVLSFPWRSVNQLMIRLVSEYLVRRSKIPFSNSDIVKASYRQDRRSPQVHEGRENKPKSDTSLP